METGHLCLTRRHLKDAELSDMIMFLLQNNNAPSLVDASWNRLEGKDFPIEFWQCLRTCTGLLLKHNLMESIAIPIKMQYLKILDFSFNKISKLDDGIFMHVPNLESLRLEGNLLESVPKSLFRLCKLQSLYLGTDLGGNIIKNLSLRNGNMTCLQELHVNSNNLERFPLVKDIQSLKLLKLAHNKISNLDNFDFDYECDLVEIDLEGNNLSKLPARITWPKSLKILNLMDNHIKHIPQSFLAPLPETCVFLLSGNPCMTEMPLKDIIYQGADAGLNLLELAARKLSIREAPTIERTLTPPICSYLAKPLKTCASCPLIMFSSCAEIIESGMVRSHPNVSTSGVICSKNCLARLKEECDNVNLNLIEDDKGFVKIE